MIKYSIKQWLKDTLKDRDLSVKQLSIKSKVSVSVLNGLLYSTTNPQLFNAQKLFNALGYDLVLVKRQDNSQKSITENGYIFVDEQTQEGEHGNT